MRKIFVCFIALFASTLVFAQQGYQNALKYLLENNRARSVAMLQPMVDASNPDATLTLALYETSNEHYDKGFALLKKFLENTPDPYPYIYAFWSSGVFNYKNAGKDVIKFMEKLAGDDKAPSTLRAMANSNIASYYYSLGKIKDCKEQYKKLADIGNWSTVGVFENMSGSGFNKDYGVLAHPQSNHTFKNNQGVDVKWFRMDHNLGHWWDFEYHYDIDDALIYGQTFVTSAQDRDVIMKVGVSGSFKVWLNDFLVASESEERNTNLDVFNYVVKLKSGVNRILIQMGSSEISNNNFMVRFTDMNDKLITDLTSQAEYAPYKKESGYEVKQLPFFAESFFEQKLKKSADNFLDLMMLISVYNQNDKKHEARIIAQKLKTLYPKSTLVAEKVTESYSRDNNNTDLTREFESIKTNDPESLYGLILRYNDAINKEDYQEAWQLLQKRENLYGLSKAIINNRISIHAKKQEYEELLQLLNDSYKKYPDDDGFVSMQYLVMSNVSKDPKKSAAILKSYLDDHFDDGIYDMLAESYMENGKKDEAMKMYKKYVEYFPYATNKYASISDEFFAMQDYNSALEWIEKALERAPYVGAYHYKLGRIYEAQGNKTRAKAIMQTAIRYSPGNFEARRKIRELDGKKDLFEALNKTNIDAHIKSAPDASKYPNDNSVYLLEDIKLLVYPQNGASEERAQLLIKVLNQAGIDRWKEISIPYNYYTEKLIIEKAELFKKDGTKVQAEEGGNQLVFSTLEVGDIVHINYRKEIVYSGKLAEHFWETFTFNGGLPVKECRYTLIVPKNKNFVHKMYNGDLQPKIQDVDDYKVYVWERMDVPAIKPESYMPAYADVEQKLVVSSIPDWNYVANWYRDLSSVKAKADFEVTDKVKELFQGKEKLSPLAKARLIYDYIQTNFNYSNIPFLHSALTPQRASRTLQTKLGDCKDLSTLFVAMSREVGLDASLVLVDTRDNGDKNLDLPTIGFNHCIAQLKIDGKTYLVELTDNKLPFGAMPNNLVNANGLFIPKESDNATTASLVKLNTQARPMNTIDRTTTVKFMGTNVNITRRSSRAGAQASAIRENYRNKGKEDNLKNLSEQLTGEFNKKVSLKDLKITNLDNLSDTLIFESNFDVSNYTSELVGMQVFTLPWTDRYYSLDFVSLDKRDYPISLWQLSSTPYDKEIMTVYLPAGAKLAEIPKNVSFSCPAASYSLTYKVEGDKLVATREVKYLKEYVAPENYAAFKDFITQMNAADSKQLAFK